MKVFCEMLPTVGIPPTSHLRPLIHPEKMKSTPNPKAVASSVGRNDICPCGSGRRYKHCCGSRAPARALAVSDSIHEKMDRALQHQMDAEYVEAKTLYEQALVDARENPDALNMLALVEYNLGNIDIAMKLAEEAVRLAPSVPMIRTNRTVIASAWGLRKYRGSLFDPALDKYPKNGPGRPLVHIYQIAGNPSGGSEWHAIELARRLRESAEVVLWTQHSGLPEVLRQGSEVRVIDESRGIFPQGGTLLVAGSYHRVGRWFEDAVFRRIVVLYNVVDPLGLSFLLDQVCLPGKPKVELLFASDWMRSVSGLPGVFEPSPVDIELFSPAASAPHSLARRLYASFVAGLGRHAESEHSAKNPGEFVVGRLSRDDPMKYHGAAGDFYKMLAAEGCVVKLMGGTPLASELGEANGVMILPQNAMPAVDFLRSLDCFTYRTNASWTEAWGRVVTEAMAVGLPVVAHANGGYAQLIRHEENGFLFHRDADALRFIRRLRDSPDLRQAVGANARQTILELCSVRGFKRFVEFYLQ